MWVDSHCHLWGSDDSPDALLERTAAAGVDWLMCPGTDLESSLESHRISIANRDRVLWAAGLHPHDAVRWEDEGSRLTTLIAKADAIGECGLDYYRDHSPRPVQRAVFQEQIRLAGELGLPIIVHCRDAFADVYEDLAAADLGEKAILHSWTGGPKWTKRFNALGVTFSFAGMVTYPTAETVRLAVKVAPRERCMIETDTPYLPPQAHRDEANEPAFVPYVGRQLAEAWEIPEEEVAELTAATAARVYGRNDS